MLKIFLVTMFLVQGVYANDVELKINGEQYYCSKDPSEGGSSGIDCENAKKKISQKYEVCKQSFTSSSCYNNIKADVDKNKSCADVVDFCYKACTESFTSSSCYNSCYQN